MEAHADYNGKYRQKQDGKVVIEAGGFFDDYGDEQEENIDDVNPNKAVTAQDGALSTAGAVMP